MPWGKNTEPPQLAVPVQLPFISQHQALESGHPMHTRRFQAKASIHQPRGQRTRHAPLQTNKHIQHTGGRAGQQTNEGRGCPGHAPRLGIPHQYIHQRISAAHARAFSRCAVSSQIDICAPRRLPRHITFSGRYRASRPVNFIPFTLPVPRYSLWQSQSRGRGQSRCEYRVL